MAQLESSSERISLYAQRIAKAARAFAYESEEIRSELANTAMAQSIRHARYNQSRQRVNMTGLVTPAMARSMKKKQMEGDELVALDRLRPKWKKVMAELRRYCRVKGRRIK